MWRRGNLLLLRCDDGDWENWESTWETWETGGLSRVEEDRAGQKSRVGGWMDGWMEEENGG